MARRKSAARQRRDSILAAARFEASRGNHETARLLFASVDISYVPAAPAKEQS